MKKTAVGAALASALAGAVPATGATHTWRETRASWYTGSRGACGRLTGNYAAHRTLPCGTKLRVSRGTRRITVVIRDRGPYVAGRGLDLSKAAYAELAPPSRGVVTVEYKRAESRVTREQADACKR